MQTLRTSIVAVALALAPLTAFAQGAVTPGTPTTAFVPTGQYAIFWDAATPASAAAEDQVAGYELVSFTNITGGVQVRTWAIGNVTDFVVPGNTLGTVPVVISLRAVAQNGLKSTFSNSLPFVPASAPGVPGRLRRTATQTP